MFIIKYFHITNNLFFTILYNEKKRTKKKKTK